MIRHSGFPQKVVTAGEDSSILAADLDDIPTTPDSWVALPSGADLSVVHSQPQISEMQNRIDADLRHFALINGLSPDSFLKTYQNTSALNVQRHDRKIQRQRIEKACRQLESDLCRLIVKVLNEVEVLNLPSEGLECSVRFSEFVLDSDQSAAQARQIAYTAGELSPASFIAKRDNISEAAALQKYRSNVRLSSPEKERETGSASPEKEEASPEASSVLNGAQIQSAQGIVEGVAEGRLPRQTAKEMLVEFLAISPATAERILGPVGKSFSPVGGVQ